MTLYRLYSASVLTILGWNVKKNVSSTHSTHCPSHRELAYMLHPKALINFRDVKHVLRVSDSSLFHKDMRGAAFRLKNINDLVNFVKITDTTAQPNAMF